MYSTNIFSNVRSNARSKYMVFILLLIVPLLGGCASAIIGGGATVGVASLQERGLEQAARDVKMATQIRANYVTTNGTIAVNVGITVYENRVLLTGILDSEELRAEAVKLAWQINNIKDVINEIQLRSGEGAVEFMHDAWITTQLQAKLTFDQDILAINYAIETVNGTIYLIGIAINKDEHDRVLAHARDIDRVRRVISHVRIMEPVS
jgi:osmotically-inducible protein OsmY